MELCVHAYQKPAASRLQVAIVLLSGHYNSLRLAGTDWKSLIGTVFIVCAPCGIFFGFVASKIGPNISWALVAIIAAELLACMFCLCMTALRDPGFYPRDDGNRPEAKL